MIAYLVQGKAKEVEGLHRLFQGRNMFSLTWDEMRDGSVFLPGSTWSEGRRHLYESLDAAAGWTYVVFMDGDVVITLEHIDGFERALSVLAPAIAVPVFDKTAKYMKLASSRSWQLAYDSDEQYQAIRYELLRDYFGGSPYVSCYDGQSWWYPCVLMQNICRKLLWRSFIQVNDVRVGNPEHGEYTNDFSGLEIDRELRRLGVRSALPLSANKRPKRFWLLKARWLDQCLFWSMGILSPLLYRPWHQLDPVPLPEKVKQLITEPHLPAIR